MTNSELLISELKSGRCMKTVVAPHLCYWEARRVKESGGLSCLRADQGQLNKLLDKERQRAAEYLAAKKEADTLEGRANQLEVEIRKLRRKHKQVLQKLQLHNELIQKVLRSLTEGAT
ncbi:unnamed protein product [Brassica oleracea var. botrytis]|uniref:Uncharacterized protein n=1 Tax=Brassica oleracea var. oleracea TaxID=109376 RepID=A0A0D3E2E6_BRAOL